MVDTDTVFLVVDIVGIFIGAATGALVGLKLRYDIMGLWFLALVTGLGGGMIRDTMLQIGAPLALTNAFYLPTVAVATAIVAVFGRHVNQLKNTITLLDAIALANFAVAGTLRSYDAGLRTWPAILLGVMTAVGGGIMRDMMIGQVPTIFRRAELYGLAALGACLTVVIARSFGIPREIVVLMGVGVGIFLRLGSLRYGWMSWEPKQF